MKQLTTTKSDRCLLTENKANEGKVDKGQPDNMQQLSGKIGQNVEEDALAYMRSPDPKKPNPVTVKPTNDSQRHSMRKEKIQKQLLQDQTRIRFPKVPHSQHVTPTHASIRNTISGHELPKHVKFTLYDNKDGGSPRLSSGKKPQLSSLTSQMMMQQSTQPSSTKLKVARSMFLSGSTIAKKQAVAAPAQNLQKVVSSSFVTQLQQQQITGSFKQLVGLQSPQTKQLGGFSAPNGLKNPSDLQKPKFSSTFNEKLKLVGASPAVPANFPAVKKQYMTTQQIINKDTKSTPQVVTLQMMALQSGQFPSTASSAKKNKKKNSFLAPTTMKRQQSVNTQNEQDNIQLAAQASSIDQDFGIPYNKQRESSTTGGAAHYYSNSIGMPECRNTSANAKKFKESYGGSFEKKIQTNYAIPDSIDTGDDEDHEPLSQFKQQRRKFNQSQQLLAPITQVFPLPPTKKDVNQIQPLTQTNSQKSSFKIQGSLNTVKYASLQQLPMTKSIRKHQLKQQVMKNRLMGVSSHSNKKSSISIPPVDYCGQQGAVVPSNHSSARKQVPQQPKIISPIGKILNVPNSKNEEYHAKFRSSSSVDISNKQMSTNQAKSQAISKNLKIMAQIVKVDMSQTRSQPQSIDHKDNKDDQQKKILNKIPSHIHSSQYYQSKSYQTEKIQQNKLLKSQTANSSGRPRDQISHASIFKKKYSESIGSSSQGSFLIPNENEKQIIKSKQKKVTKAQTQQVSKAVTKNPQITRKKSTTGNTFKGIQKPAEKASPSIMKYSNHQRHKTDLPETLEFRDRYSPRQKLYDSRSQKQTDPMEERLSKDDLVNTVTQYKSGKMNHPYEMGNKMQMRKMKTNTEQNTPQAGSKLTSFLQLGQPKEVKYAPPAGIIQVESKNQQSISMSKLNLKQLSTPQLGQGVFIPKIITLQQKARVPQLVPQLSERVDRNTVVNQKYLGKEKINQYGHQKPSPGGLFLRSTEQQTKASSVLVPSDESAAQSKALLFGNFLQGKLPPSAPQKLGYNNKSVILTQRAQTKKSSFVERRTSVQSANYKQSNSSNSEGAYSFGAKQYDQSSYMHKSGIPPVPQAVVKKRKEDVQRTQCSPPPKLNVIDERLETAESCVSESLSPRARLLHNQIKKISLSFSQTGAAPETTCDAYKIGKVMGKGAFGKVNLAIHRLAKKFVALKSINKQFLSEKASKQKVMQEFVILRRLRHQNVVRLYESFETQQHIVFVMEVCGGGELLTYVRRRRRLKEDVASFIFAQIITALEYCHSKNVLHRDVKLDNILLTSQGDIKICDFGVSKHVKPHVMMKEQCGTPAYIAPEVFENKGYQGYSSDVWSAGVVLYAMLYGAVPFKAPNLQELQKQVIKCKPTFAEEISEDAMALLHGVLEKDPVKRLTIAQIRKHAWMRNNSTKKVAIFTKEEKAKIDSEFQYYNKRSERTPNCGEPIPTDPFAEQQLSSTQNSELKNITSRSVILAPFNSTRQNMEDISEDDEDEREIKQMMVPKRQILHFSAKVKEIDRQYELNNNAELDNGVYHENSDNEDESQRSRQAGESQILDKQSSLHASFNRVGAIESVGMLEEKTIKQIEHELEQETKERQNSEWKQIEKQIMQSSKDIGGGKIRQQSPAGSEKAPKKPQKKEKVKLPYTNEIVSPEQIDENQAVHQINMGSLHTISATGFPKPFLENSLRSGELNHATTFYHLLQTTKEY